MSSTRSSPPSSAKPDFAEIGFDIGDARISIGLVMQAFINLIVVGFVLFLAVRAWNGSASPATPAPTEIELLTDIRDSLRSR